jgi:uncharacterized protein YggT (Ycf19 family)
MMASSLAELLNYTLAFLFWLIVGRLALALLTGGRQTFISELFRRVTEPWYRLVRRITPGAISDRHIPFLGLLLIVNLRLLLLPLLGA